MFSQICGVRKRANTFLCSFLPLFLVQDLGFFLLHDNFFLLYGDIPAFWLHGRRRTRMGSMEILL